MAVELKVPQVGESITEVQIARWLMAEGEHVNADQVVVELESDKATVELPAPTGGTLSRLLKQPGDKAAIGEVIGYIEEGNGAAAKEPAAEEKPAPAPEPESDAPVSDEKPHAVQAKTKEPELGDRLPPTAEAAPMVAAQPKTDSKSEEPRVMPGAQRMLEQAGLRADEVEPTGPGGRVLKEDVQRAAAAPPSPVAEPAPARAAAPAAPVGEGDRVVPMSPMRKRIAERLVDAQQTAALLTTFNEIDMSGVMALREEHREAFQQRHGVKLGFMSFFVRACVEALKQLPQINAEIRGTDIVYHDHYDIGIAIGSGKGLVVPVLRGAERMSFAEIEKAVADFGERAKVNKIAIEELQGGTFTITNGGIFGSLLSTPIVNPPQSGILGMHAIQDRPVARDGQVVIRPMMYVALTYDHRLVDGREAVTFLKSIKLNVENPSRMLLEI
ncbi:MAG: 2-oxoglutarate dehydrogenase complex dihydrolipoyllysine-residue succinyltransferase [FCB group bacterium]|jgi:2-oxoglutarate dehydrogenase E2 component (dihydrolipoamide succinyltransferase)|nr:2-oxoglutarate dehydrogenase complex dihydrolipoyllysine-residue succinyltransferase [FCB group bacterium]